MTYGPMSSVANVGGSMMSSYLAPEILSYLTGEVGLPTGIAKAISAAAPALISGGIGAATSGDKYGWANAIPAGIMGAMGVYGKQGVQPTSEYSGTPQSSPIPDSTKAQLAEGDELGKLMGSKPKDTGAFQSPMPGKTQAGDTAKSSTEGGKDLASSGGIFGKLLDTDEGKMMAAMLLSNFISGPATAASTDAYYNKYNRNVGQAEAIQRARQNKYISGALGYAMGGPLNPSEVRNPNQLYPQSLIQQSDRRMGASPIRREVIDGPSFKHGELVGPGDGMSDSIPANIDGKRKAKVATGEFVVPREAADQYGDKLDKMMKAVRAASHPKKGEQVKQDAGKRAFIQAMSGVKA